MRGHLEVHALVASTLAGMRKMRQTSTRSNSSMLAGGIDSGERGCCVQWPVSVAPWLLVTPVQAGAPEWIQARSHCAVVGTLTFAVSEAVIVGTCTSRRLPACTCFEGEWQVRGCLWSSWRFVPLVVVVVASVVFSTVVVKRVQGPQSPLWSAFCAPCLRVDSGLRLSSCYSPAVKVTCLVVCASLPPAG